MDGCSPQTNPLPRITQPSGAEKEMKGKKDPYESRRQLRAEVQELRKRLARCERELRNVDAVIADKDVTYDQIRSWEDEGGSIS